MIQTIPLRIAVLAFAFLCSAAIAETGASPKADPKAILAAAKEASGGAAWDKLLTQHSKVTLSTGGLKGPVERWSDLASGRSYLRYDLGAVAGALGFDGAVTWSQDSSGQSRVEADAGARELAVNAAYRDQLGFWFPDRRAATIEYKGRSEADGAEFDIVAITPKDGREFVLLVNTQTKLIERLVEKEAAATRTEVYMDFRGVQGVKVPYRVRTTRGDPKFDEVIVVDALEYNAPLAGVQFAQPGPPKPDFEFPTGKSSIDVPFEIHNGHMFLRAKLNGKGPYLMLFDTGGVNVMLPEVAAALGLKPEGALAAVGVGESRQDVGFTSVDSIEIDGIVVRRQRFATLDLGDFMRRVEGLDNVSGLIGYELFKRFPVRLDYERSRATFYDPAQFKYAGKGIVVPFKFHEHVPQVQGSVDGIAGSFDIDTGSRVSLTLAAPFAEKNGIAARIGATSEIISGAGVGGYAHALLGRSATLKLGDVAIQRPVTYVSTATSGAFADPELAGNVGYGILRRFNITYDYPNERLYLESNGSYGEPDVHDRAGLWVEQGRKGYVLIEVVSDGPGAKAGLKSGDVVTAIDGKPASAVTLSQLRAMLKATPGTIIRLQVAGGKTHAVALRDMI